MKHEHTHDDDVTVHHHHHTTVRGQSPCPRFGIPHGTNGGTDTILQSALSFVRYAEPIAWDGNDVRFVVGIAGKDNGHLEILSRIAVIFSDEDEVQKLLQADSAEGILAVACSW